MPMSIHWCIMTEDAAIVGQVGLKQWKKLLLIRSRSKKGYIPDYSAFEGFFERLKNEMFYNRNWNHISRNSFIKELDTYMYWCNEERMKRLLGGISPLQYKRNLGIATQSMKTSARPHKRKVELKLHFSSANLVVKNIARLNQVNYNWTMNQG